MSHGALRLGERPGSGDGERKTLLTRQIAFEPLPASVLFGLGGSFVLRLGRVGKNREKPPSVSRAKCPLVDLGE
jgi:hypothetical protein